MKAYFEREGCVLVYLIRLKEQRNAIADSDIDIAFLLAEPPRGSLELYLRLSDELSKMLREEVDLIILNEAPPLLKHQVIKHGRVIYCRDGRARVEFEARAKTNIWISAERLRGMTNAS
ncbi:MAG: nucleotidyltransferase domain-containing protein [Candidatus Bathyarchaeia archaeon]